MCLFNACLNAYMKILAFLPAITARHVCKIRKIMHFLAFNVCKVPILGQKSVCKIQLCEVRGLNCYLL